MSVPSGADTARADTASPTTAFPVIGSRQNADHPDSAFKQHLANDDDGSDVLKELERSLTEDFRNQNTEDRQLQEDDTTGSSFHPSANSLPHHQCQSSSRWPEDPRSPTAGQFRDRGPPSGNSQYDSGWQAPSFPHDSIRQPPPQPGSLPNLSGLCSALESVAGMAAAIDDTYRGQVMMMHHRGQMAWTEVGSVIGRLRSLPSVPAELFQDLERIQHHLDVFRPENPAGLMYVPGPGSIPGSLGSPPTGYPTPTNSGSFNESMSHGQRSSFFPP